MFEEQEIQSVRISAIGISWCNGEPRIEMGVSVVMEAEAGRFGPAIDLDVSFPGTGDMSLADIRKRGLEVAAALLRRVGTFSADDLLSAPEPADPFSCDPEMP